MATLPAPIAGHIEYEGARVIAWKILPGGDVRILRPQPATTPPRPRAA